MSCLCVGCSGNNNDDGMVDYLEAKEMIINENAVLLDVRTQEEYDTSHINGSVLLTLDNITEDTVSAVINSKDTVIIVYCRSGNRSAQAKVKLEQLGYTNVYDLGSMDNWKE